MMVEIATILAFLVSVFALGFVIYQTYLTCKALDLTRDSFDATKKSMDATTRSTALAIRMMQIEMLPSANWVIQVQVALENWSRDLESVIADSLAAEHQRDAKMLQTIAGKGLRTPKGLVRLLDAEHTPKWLCTIWLNGAQYYYNAKAVQIWLWKERDDEPGLEYVPNFIVRCKDSIDGIQQLLQMIHDVVPAAYLNTPASLSNDRFFD